MISIFNIFFYLSQTHFSAISSYCSLLTISFDAIFGDSWLLMMSFLTENVCFYSHLTFFLRIFPL
ncbi:MAG: C4-dicarboxylate ABC transporter [Hapalosiphonaceae cyanobacterium JJU2]|nr:MAG: C4-dicarboxylate ABC transporter [Hapalosiphonaceae cyanobacterium JJU2]